MLEPLTPMLAHTYDPHKHILPKNVVVQPKLDGVRCLIHIVDGRVNNVISRSGKPVYLGNEIPQHLNELFPERANLWLDGELYVHGEAFQDIQRAASIQDNTPPDKDILRYCIYDCYLWRNAEATFSSRQKIMHGLVNMTGFRLSMEKWLLGTKLTMVLGFRMKREDVECEIEEQISYKKQIEEVMEQAISQGYEGIMIRDADSTYKHGRSRGLLKYKRFHDEEYIIVAVKEGAGKNKGTAVLVCCLNGASTSTFNVTAPGTYADKAHAWANRTALIGQQVTVKYQEKTKAGIPRFPVAKSFV